MIGLLRNHGIDLVHREARLEQIAYFSELRQLAGLPLQLMTPLGQLALRLMELLQRFFMRADRVHQGRLGFGKLLFTRSNLRLEVLAGFPEGRVRLLPPNCFFVQGCFEPRHFGELSLHPRFEIGERIGVHPLDLFPFPALLFKQASGCGKLLAQFFRASPRLRATRG